MLDRVPQNPGRVLITPENGGEAFYATMERADNPTQEGDRLNKATFLKDETCDLMGLPHTATPNDAFARLTLPDGKYAVKVSVFSPGGIPMAGVTIDGITTMAGSAAVTGSDGTVIGFTTSSSLTLTAVNDRLDINGDQSLAVTLDANVLNAAEIHFTRVSSTSATFSASTKVRFSPDVDSFDCSAIGGGTNGSNGSVKSSYAKGGKGGNAGAVENKANIKNDESAISIVVGGIGGTSQVGNHITALGGGGAVGGSGGYASVSKQTDATKGEDTTTPFMYPPTSVGGAAGGGGAYWRGQGIANNGNGGAPGGGKGNQYASGLTSGLDGSLPGSGGGGGGAYHDDDSDSTTDAGSGKAGLCGIMWRYKS